MRKTKIFTVPGTRSDQRGERDNGKHFLITEKSAVEAEKWAQRALLAITNSGVDIPPEVLQMGAGAVLAAGMRALMTMGFADAEPLLVEMMQCVQVMPDRAKPDVVRAMDDEDVEEVKTLLLLRSEVIEVHTGFSVVAALSRLGQVATTQTPGSKDIPTSPKPSE